MSNNEIKIEGCPFCGSAQTRPVASKYNGKDGWQVICMMCNASGAHSVEENVAIAHWNAVVKACNE